MLGLGAEGKVQMGARDDYACNVSTTSYCCVCVPIFVEPTITTPSEHVFYVYCSCRQHPEHKTWAPNSSAAAACHSRHPRAAPSSSTTTSRSYSPALAHLGYFIFCSFASVRLRLNLGCGPRDYALHFPVEVSLDGDKH
jgi:hypothetical protein